MNSLARTLEIQLFQPDPALLCGIDATAQLAGMSRRMILLCCKHRLVEAMIDSASGALYFDQDAVRHLRRIEALREFCGGSLDAVRMILALQDELGRVQAELRFWRG